MAKRKKLNKRVVIFLVLAGAVVAAGGAALIFKNLPRDPEVYLRRARDAEAAKPPRLFDAEKDYLRAIDAASDPKAEYYYDLARIQLEIRKQPNIPQAERSARLGRAIDLYRTALRRDPQFRKAQESLTEVYWLMAVTGGQWQAFITEADRMISMVPDDDQTYFKRAIAKSRMAETIPGTYTEAAIADFRKTIELKPDEPDHWLQLIAFLKRINRSAEAEQVFAESLETVPDSAKLRVEYAGHLSAKGEKDRALEQIQQAITREPDSTLGHLELASFYTREQDLDKAMESLEAARKVDDSDYLVYQT